MSGGMKFAFCNVPLIQEWSGTCNEYLPMLKKPFSPIPVKEIFKCQQSNWEEAYRQWGVIQFWTGVIVGIVTLLVLIIGYGSAGMSSGIQSLLQQIIVAYIFAHLGWFAVVKKKGCCCCFIVCCEATQLLLLWGIMDVLWGVMCILNALNFISLCGICFLIAVFQILYATTQIYMGIACIRLWQAAGAEIAPKAVEVDGPSGEAVGKTEGP